MARLSSTPLLLLAFLAILLSAAAPATANDHPSLHVSLNHGKLGSTSSAAVVIGATIRSCEAKTKAARQYALQLAAHAKNSMTRQNLKVCAEVYGDALAELQKSLKSLQGRSRLNLAINLSAAMTNFATCEDGFAQSNPGSRSPLASYNNALNKIVSNGLALVKRLR